MRIAVQWKDAPGEVHICIEHGRIHDGEIVCGEGSIANGKFNISGKGQSRLEFDVEAENVKPGAKPTIIGIRTDRNPFSFFVRDICKQFPIIIPAYGVAVCLSDDRRSYTEIEQAVLANGLATNLQKIDNEPEESWDDAAANTRELIHPIWLGVSRDVRVFEMGLRQPMTYTDWVWPRFHGNNFFWEEHKEYKTMRYGFVAGRGWNCAEEVERRLENGVLPIMLVTRIDDDIRYEHTSFCALEKERFVSENVRGTHALVADWLSVCNALNEDQEKAALEIRDSELKRDEETVFCCRIVATNTGFVPRYAFFKTLYPHVASGDVMPHQYDRENGLSMHNDSELVYAVSRVDGTPMPQEEMAILLQPGESTVLEMLMPHQPIPKPRAMELAGRNMMELLEECRAFWSNKLAVAAQIRVPEQRIDEMLRAGYIHLDMTTYGLEPNGSLNATDGVYGPVSAENWVNLNFYDSIGMHDTARRCLQYWLDKQYDNGFMQNFEGYMLDTGCVLFALGEHYRYTRDDDWVRQIADKVKKSCEFLIAWRGRNKIEELRGKGYGMLEGKVADPEDEERIYMLNAYAYIGLARVSEMLATVDPDYSEGIRREAAELRNDIRETFFESIATSPVIPLGNGAWCPTAPPWVGPRGPKCLFVDGDNWWTHGSMTTRDDVIGPLHLVSEEVIDYNELAASMMLDYHSDLMFLRNVASSQPYYSRHQYVHLQRDEVKRFLKAYYNTFAALADRDIYSFWEHFYHESPNKTHEEAEFMMDTRWMLYMEEGDTLHVLRGVPRAWLQSGKRIELNDVGSYFGKLSISVVSKLDQGMIEAEVNSDSERKPRSLMVRLPHPDGKKAISVVGGEYIPEREVVCISDFTGYARVQAFFSI